MHTWPRAQEISLLMILESPCCESSLFRSYRMHAAPIFQLLFIYPQTYGRNPRIDAIFWKTIAQGRASHRCSPLHGYAIDHTFYPFQFLANEISDKREFQYIVKILYLQILFARLNIYCIVFLENWNFVIFHNIYINEA